MTKALGNKATEAFSPVDAKGLANLLLDWASDIGQPITPMKLQKLVYYCHADFLIRTGKPLIKQDFEAWEFGPVIPSLYHEFKQFGSDEITSRAFLFNPVSCELEKALPCDLGENEDLIRSTFEAYARYTASTLSNMTHSEEGPWAETLRRFAGGSVKGRSIENHVIARCHKSPFQQSVH